MDEVKEMLFRMQRFQILTLFTNPQAERNVTPSYAFAWSESVYPFLNESADWHQPYKALFKIQEEDLEELHDLLCDKWDKKQPISFYELESHYRIHGSSSPGPVWSRSSLWKACRYFYLHRHFDQSFWSALLENGKCPSEAHSIAREFVASDVYFE